MKNGNWVTSTYRAAIGIQFHSAVSLPFVDGMLANLPYKEGDGNLISASAHQTRKRNCESMLCTGVHAERNTLARLHMPGDKRGWGQATPKPDLGRIDHDDEHNVDPQSGIGGSASSDQLDASVTVVFDKKFTLKSGLLTGGGITMLPPFIDPCHIQYMVDVENKYEAEVGYHGERLEPGNFPKPSRGPSEPKY